MSRGKYSPTVYSLKHQGDYIYNARGETPVEWNREKDCEKDYEKDYDPETMSDDYDSEGFDSYGYSAYSQDGTFVGSCYGIDRNGYTEDDYMNMSDEEFDRI